MSLDKEEDEEQLVLIQFTDIDDANYCQHYSNKFKSIDIQSTNPIIQIGNRFYSGEYINNIGTYLFFEQSSETNPTFRVQQQTDTTEPNNFSIDKSSESDLNFNYSGKSFKKLVLSRLFIEEKEQL